MSPGPEKQFDRDAVLEKAMCLFWEQGYEATGMAQLVRHMGIGRQSLYDTFGDKRTLFLETLAHYFRTRVGPIMAQLRSPGSPLGNIRRVFRILEKMAGERDFYGCFIGNSSGELGCRDPEIAKRLKGYFRTLEDAFHHALVRAQAEGELPKDLNPRDLARTFVNTTQGLALLNKVMHDPEVAKSVLRSSLKMLQTG